MEEQSRITKISPREFEQLVRDYLEEIGRAQGLKELLVTHDTKLPGPGGDYQIDVLAVFEALGGEFKVLIECKHYNKRVPRDDVLILQQRLELLHAQKGMLFSNAGFQKGAHKFAEAYSIALISVIEGRFTYKTKSQDSPDFDPPEWADVQKYVCEYQHNFTENGHTITYLQKGYMEDLSDFFFGKLE